MNALRRLFRSRSGQTMTEYMVLLSVVAVGVMAAFALFAEPDKPVQQAAGQVADNYERGLTNDGGNMSAQ